MLRLTGTALITGAAQGIGKATALAYARAGATAIAIADIKTRQLQEVIAEARKVATNKGFEVIAIHTDVTDEESVSKMVEKTVSAFGRIDYAANIAGRSESGKAQMTAEKTTKDFNFTNDVNLYGLFYCQREELKAMRKQELVVWGDRPAVRGSIVNMASVAGLQSLKGCAAYVTGKHAAIGMTRCAAADHGEDSIRVNAICPGPVETALLDGFSAVPNFRQFLLGATMMGRLGQPEEIADVILFMSSPLASYVTGATWTVDGGASVI